MVEEIGNARERPRWGWSYPSFYMHFIKTDLCRGEESGREDECYRNYRQGDDRRNSAPRAASTGPRVRRTKPHEMLLNRYSDIGNPAETLNPDETHISNCEGGPQYSLRRGACASD